MRNFTILVDFDGTVVSHEYPYVGVDIGAVKPLQYLTKNGVKLILFTMRDKQELADAVKWFEDNHIQLYGIQENPTQKSWTTSPKAYGHLIIDDTCLGIDLKLDKERPYVDWLKTSERLTNMNLLTQEQFDDIKADFAKKY